MSNHAIKVHEKDPAYGWVMVFAVFLSMSKSTSLSNYLAITFNYESTFLLPLSYMVLVIISICIGRVITKFAHIAFLSVENRIMNHIMGSLFGMIKGGISLMIFLWLISILPLQKWTNVMSETSNLINYSKNKSNQLFLKASGNLE